MTLVKAVFLDIDGTLMDTNYLHIEAWAQAFEEVGARPPRSRIHHEVGKGSEKLITEFVEEDQKAERVSELHSEYYAKLQERGHPLPGAKELIASLVDRGYEVWLATSAEPEELEHHMQELGAEGKISGVVSSDEAEESKPPPTSSGSPWSGRGLSRGCRGGRRLDLGHRGRKRSRREGRGGHDRWCFQPGRAGGGGCLRGLRRLSRFAQRRFPREKQPYRFVGRSKLRRSD